MQLSCAQFTREIIGANNIVRTGVIGYSDRFREALFPAF